MTKDPSEQGLHQHEDWEGGRVGKGGGEERRVRERGEEEGRERGARRTVARR